MKKVFIGSSTTALSMAYSVKRILESLEASVTFWDCEKAFVAGDNLTDDLIIAAHQHDAGVFILNKDDQLTTPANDSKKYITRDNVLIEAGMFMGTLGRKSVALCIAPGVHEPSDFKGIVKIQYNDRDFERLEKDLKNWLDKNVKEHHSTVGENNVLMLTRRQIHNRYSTDNRLHISDGFYKKICHVRLMNLACNIVINPEIRDIGHMPPKDIPLSMSIEQIMRETEANVELILTQPNEYNLNDLKSKIANRRAGSSEGVLYSALSRLYKNLTSDTIYKQRNEVIPYLFQLYVMKTSMPFGIFNVEFSDEAKKYNHVKVDLYSAALDNEDNRRSFVIWEEDDPENYQFFVRNFMNIMGNPSLCEKVQTESLKEWADEWERLKSGGNM